MVRGGCCVRERARGRDKAERIRSGGKGGSRAELQRVGKNDGAGHGHAGDDLRRRDGYGDWRAEDADGSDVEVVRR